MWTYYPNIRLEWVKPRNISKGSLYAGLELNRAPP
jgi:hypothetical protein